MELPLNKNILTRELDPLANTLLQIRLGPSVTALKLPLIVN
jgi:hypothetical protein